MSFEPPRLFKQSSGDLVVNGGHMSKGSEGDRKRNYKLILDPVLKGRGHQKIYRYDGEFEGQSPVIPKDPRSRRTRLWSTRTKADLPVPKFKIDKYYIGLPPQRDIILNGLNDNVDRKFLISICEKFGTIEGVKIFYDPLSKRHMGKARVGFSTSASAKLAVAKLDGTSIMGCIVHADFEHKVDIKLPVKSQVSFEHEKIPARTTPPTIERIPLPTPPPSGSSQSPSNSTPSTPGSVGLIDPRTRGVSTSSLSTEHFRGPSSPPHRTLNTAQAVTKKLPVFEPVSPPHQKVTIPLPPPPDIPPPPLPDRVSSPTTTKTSVEDKSCGKHQSKDYKESSKYSRDTHKSRQPDNDWRRRERDRERNREQDRDRYDSYNSYKSRSDRGNYRGKDLHSYKDYSSRRSDSRESYSKSRSRYVGHTSSSRDSEVRRSRDSDSGSDKSDTFRQKTKHEIKTDEAKDKKDSVQKSDVKTTIDNNGLYNLQTTKDFLLSPVGSSGKDSEVLPLVIAGQIPDNKLDNLTKDVFDTKPASLTDENTPQTDSVASVVQPIYEDISPVSSPVKPLTVAPSFPVIPPPVITLGLPETTEVEEASKGVTEDNDDAMSLSSISSNEETLEVTSGATAPAAITIPATGIHPYPPHYVPFMAPFNPAMPPPPPTMTHIPLMRPMTMTIPPHPMAHPLVPPAYHPIYPPQFMPTHAPVPTHHIHQSYQVYPPGHVPPPHEQPRPALKKTWKAKISDEVLAIVSKELEVILKRDVTQRLVEDSAFKTLDGWWDNTEKKAKVSTTNQTTTLTTTSTTAPTAITTTTTNTNDITVSALFSTSISQGGAIGLGLRASLPKMPSFRKRQPDIDKELKRKQDEISSKGDSDSEYSSSQYNDGSSVRKKLKNDELFSPEESMEDPPATSVRTKEKQLAIGSSLYTNIYSSLSESDASLSDADSDSNWDDESEDERSLSSQSNSEYPSDHEGGDKQFQGITSGIPRTPPGTPPDTPPQTPPLLPQTPAHAPRTPSSTPPPSPVESLKDDLRSTGTLNDDLGSAGIEHSVITDSTAESEELKPSCFDNNKQSELTNEATELVSSSELKQDSLAKESSVISDSSTSIEKAVTEDDTVEEPSKPEIPVFQYPPEFPVRPYWQDNQLVYDFLVSGLDYEDASYFKVGFENLERVGSDCIADAYWSFHPTTASPAAPPVKGRRQKLDNGVRVHSSGSARCEGYYKIGMQEKAKYLETARRQVDKTQMIDKKKAEEKEANKAKQQSRENRALQRRLAASFQNEDFGDIVKFNQLKVRKKKLTFSKSCIHDWGLFALEPIGPDEMVIEYIGEVVRQAIADDREKRYEKLGIGSSYLFRVDSDTIIDATKYGNLARFINHCCEPNCYAKVVTLESEKRIVIYSKRDIAVNEEITYDYKFPLEDDKIPCLCGATQCRGTLN